MIFAVIKPIRVKSKGRVLRPGETLEADPKVARRYINLGALRAVEDRTLPKTRTSPRPPINPGWVVSFRGPSGKIEGGTVTAANPRRDRWMFRLSNGIELRDSEILSVGAVENGQWLGAWTVARWGLDGERLMKASVDCV